MWKIKPFNELTTMELYKILYLRTKTFVVEQQRVYQEVDENDLKAIHIFKEENNQVVAYARIFLENDNQAVTFGRVVTDKSLRGQGLGKELMEHVMQAIQQYYPNYPIEIEAQTQVQGFYEKYDFQTASKPFIFESTPHIKMLHKPLKTK